MATINKIPKKKRENKPKQNLQKEIHEKVYNTKMWRDIRKSMLMIHPLCQNCNKNLATEVHHIKPLTTAKDEIELLDLGFNTANLMCLCEECHRNEHRKLKEGKRNE